ncbi:MAG: glycosyltransferase family 2 protein [Muribaculaceae bacterium]|nr:glycosyltransferase family 2 protein [Muribaculaceae bacterium]
MSKFYNYQNPVISIILPVYNGQSFIKKCINSILIQTFFDFELIIINDGSKDKTLDKLLVYKKKDKRIVLYNLMTNIGLEASRLKGIHIARGKYIFFIDADDWLLNKDVLKKLYLKSIETDADYVEIGYKRVYDKYCIFNQQPFVKPTGLITSPYLQKNYFQSFFGVNSLNVCCWGKLYKKSIITNSNIKVLGLKYDEDRIFNLQLFPNLKKIYILNDIGYCYRYGGLSYKFNSLAYDSLKKNLDYKIEILERFKVEGAKERLLCYMKDCLKAYIRYLIECDRKDKSLLVEIIKKEINDLYYYFFNRKYLLNLYEINDFSKKILGGDIEDIYNQCYKEAKNGHYLRVLKSYIVKLLRHLP